MRLASRVTLAVTTVTIVVLAASFATVLLLVSRDELRDLDRSLLLQAQASADRALLRSQEHPRVGEGDAHVPERIGSITRYVAIYEADGSASSFSSSFAGALPPLSSLDVSPAPPEAGETVDLAVRGTSLRGVLIPLGAQGQTLLFAVPRKTIDEDLQFLWRLVAALFVLALGLTSLLARWISGRISSDVEAIAAVARAVTGGDLEARVGANARGSTETLTLGADMDRMIHQLGSVLRAQRIFVSHAAHELRSPLSTIRGELQLALRRERSAEEYRKAIEETLTDVHSLTALTEGLLVLARAQSGSGPGREPELCTLGDIVSETLHTVRGVAKERGVPLVVAGLDDAKSLRVSGSRSDLVRALRNLIDNAVAHSDPGNEVTLGFEVTNGSIGIAVTDRGPGISAQDATNIFEPFFRSSKDQASDRPGAGLGLTIARDIVRAHGGELSLAPDQRIGSKFVLQLPLDPGNE